MAKFPMKFEVEANASSGINTPWTSQTDLLPPIPNAISPEFKGPGGGYSPEDLFALAVINCVIATFKVYAEKSNLSFQSLTGKASLTVDKFPAGEGFGMTQIDITLEIRNVQDHDTAKKLMEAAIKDCAVSNSIKSGKTFHIHIT